MNRQPDRGRKAVRRARRVALAAGLVAAVLGAGAPVSASDSTPDSAPDSVAHRSTLAARDLPVVGRIFERGLPVTPEAFSPDGLHYAYLHFVSGGFPRRKPERCTFLLDLTSLDNRPVKTPKGRAARIAGWDRTARLLLIEATSPHLLTPFTGKWTTFHWIFDVVTSQFVQRKPYTGEREGQRFRWKHDGTLHGVWRETESGAEVVALEGGELTKTYEAREIELGEEAARRTRFAMDLAVGANAANVRVLGPELSRLDEHWTRRGQKDSIVSDLFGERPRLFARRGDAWIELAQEIEYVAVLDHGLALITFQEGEQAIFDLDRWEMAALPSPPAEFRDRLRTRWERAGGTYDEHDPLPRDLQYRRSYDVSQGTVYYFNYVTPARQRALILYSIDADHRVLRVVDLPAAWAVSERPRPVEPAPSP